MKKTIETSIKITEILILKLFDKDYRAAITKMLQQPIASMLQTNEKKSQPKKVCKEIEDMKGNQMGILELKNPVTKMNSR